jgi:hypothetical protein
MQDSRGAIRLWHPCVDVYVSNPQAMVVARTAGSPWWSHRPAGSGLRSLIDELLAPLRSVPRTRIATEISRQTHGHISRDAAPLTNRIISTSVEASAQFAERNPRC